MIYIIVPVHNRSPITSRFLDALRRQNCTDFRLILVDDGCTDDTVAIARRKLSSSQLHVLHGDGQLWWAGALQAGYEYLTRLGPEPDDAVLIVNDDVDFDPDFLVHGLTALAEQPQACFQAIGIDRRSGERDCGAVADLVRLRFRAAVDGEKPNCLSTRGLLMRASTFLQSGGFRPRWLPHYLSDYEFTLRLRRHGTPLQVDDRFRAEIALELTGLDEVSAPGAKRYWKDSFSNRAKFNPKHWCAFVVLACPWPLVPWHVARIWIRFTRLLILSSVRGVGQVAR
jgi:GT2 family glycosyltransferase